MGGIGLRKQVVVYFNLKDSEELELWNFLQDKKKNKYIKRLIYNDVHNVPSRKESLTSSNDSSDNSIDILDSENISDIIM